MILKDFLQNPSGKSSSMFYNRQLAKESMENKLINYMKIKHGGERAFVMNVYKAKNGIFLFHFLLPSELYPNLVYDVILEFSPPPTKSSTLMNYNIRFFSNSPAFTFTYTFVMNKMKLLFNDLKKSNKLALTKPPKITNPIQILGFEKSIYVCGLYIMKKKDKLMDVSYLTSKATPYNKKKLGKLVKSDDLKLKEYRIAKTKYEKAQKNKKIQDMQKVNAAKKLKNEQSSKTNRELQKKGNKLKTPKRLGRVKN